MHRPLLVPILIGLTATCANAQTWQPGYGPPSQQGLGFDGTIFSWATFDAGTGGELYAGGSFVNAGGTPANHLVRRTSTGWSEVGGGLTVGNGGVYAMRVHDDGTGPALYVAGRFTAAGGIPFQSIARWNGSVWSDVGGGLTRSGGSVGEVYDLEVYDSGNGPGLYATGRFDFAGQTAVVNLARWQGGAWSDVGGGYLGALGGCCPYSLHVHDDGNGPALFVAGEAGTVGGTLAVNGIARWNGTSWQALGSGFTGGPFNFGAAMASFDDGTGSKLFVGGDFAQAGGVTVNHVARWDGNNWQALGSGLAGTAFPYGGNGMATFDDGTGTKLYVTGLFETAGIAASESIARWTGSNWESLEGGVQDASFTSAGVMHVFDDGQGPQLFVGGFFQIAGGMHANNLGVWAARQPSLQADGGLLSLAAGGTRNYRIRFGAQASGQLFGLLGSIDGNDPGTPIPGGLLPLNAPIITLQVGILGAQGDATASLALPSGSSSSLLGLVADLAAITVAFPLQIRVTNAATFWLRP
jgi:trimeric autotransporter adhesin